MPMTARVLIVDDEPGLCTALREALTDAGYVVRSAPDGRAALHAIAADPPDLMLSDIAMPQLDGWTLANEVRRRFPAIAIVLMTGARPALPTDGTPILAKPFPLATMLTAVAHALDAQVT